MNSVVAGLYNSESEVFGDLLYFFPSVWNCGSCVYLCAINRISRDVLHGIGVLGIQLNSILHVLYVISTVNILYR